MLKSQNFWSFELSNLIFNLMIIYVHHFFFFFFIYDGIIILLDAKIIKLIFFVNNVIYHKGW